MIKKLFYGALSLSVLNANTQTISNVDWVKYKTERAQISNVPSAIDANNNAYITGYMYVSANNVNANTVKYSPVGAELWTASYDYNTGFDNSKAIILDAAGNSYITGESDGTGTGRDIFVVKYDPNGLQLFAFRWNGVSNGNDCGNAITLDATGNIYITGFTTNMGGTKDYITIKLNNLGLQQFAVITNGAGNMDDEAVAIGFNNNRLYVTGNSTNLSGNTDLLTLRINPANGATVWSKTENGSANSNDVAYALLPYNNDVVVVGQVNNTTTNNDYITKYYNGLNGNTVWSKIYDSNNTNGGASALTVDASGNFAVTGIVNNAGIYEYHTLLYNNSGVQQWVNISSTNLSYVSAYPQIAVDPTANHFYVCGQKLGVQSDICVYQLTPTGNKTWEEKFNGAQNGPDAAVDLVVNAQGIIYVAGASYNSNAKYDYTTIRISQTPVVFPIDYNNANEPYAQNHYFYPNSGEVLNANATLTSAQNVLYYTKHTNPQEFLLTNNKMAFVLAKGDTSGKDTLHRVDMEFYKSNPLTKAYNFDVHNTDGILNYFLGHLPSSITDVKGSSRIMYPNIYPGIDAHLYSNNKGIKMYFVVKPGTNPKDLNLLFTGANSTTITGTNQLKINTGIGNFRFEKPQVYSVNPMMNTFSVTSSWNSAGNNMYGVNTGTYNTTLPLIIQINQGAATSATIANVNWSTYFGGTLADLIYKSKSDAGNNLFVAGKTISSFFPQGVGATPFQSQLNGGFDGFLAKFKPSGELDWSTYIGAEGSEQINDFDFKGNQVYCIGSTTSFSLPALAKTGASNDNSFAGGGSDGFIFQTNIPFGNTNNWLRYYGESHTDELRACKFDAGGDFFIVGASTSTNIPVIASAGQYSQTYNPAQIWAPGPTFENTVYDGIILKFAAPSSSLTWATYYGTYSVTGIGSQYSHDEFNALDIISSTVYVGGYSTGNGLPNSLNSKGTVNWSDGILVNFSTGGVFQAARYTSNMVNNSVKVNNNKLYACGQANGGATVNSGNYYFNGTSSGGLDANFSVHSLNLTTLVHNTFLGGSLDDEARDLQFAPNSVFYVAGITGSFDFPVLAVTGAYTAIYQGNDDYFLSAFKEGNTNFVWSTCIGSFDAEGVLEPQATSITIDGNDNLHLCGATNSYTDYPLADGGGPPVYFQAQKAGGSFAPSDGTVSRFSLIPINAIVGIKEQPVSVSFGLYPNPTTQYLMLDNPELSERKSQYAVYNMTGQKVQDGMLSSQTKIIDVSLLPQGLYIIKLSNQTGTLSTKFIKVND